MYEIRCVFCRQVHRSEYFDEIEEGILACRDLAKPERQGRLEYEVAIGGLFINERVASCAGEAERLRAERIAAQR